ncbi:MAG: 50S ribosomal protein L17 [Candidatus Yanofskybacteria bacterium CG10_big_fil_rev_8_21_14_0_10_36_16]|uniref:Large ribosomal subunit protein bL17 n=1 Tax=Candidatus Yanofskybacteria bacterium CG10_big_fil_rev_8_21_14_0_10_36_16 TaxID=1975096 RepID=A0A2J0Q7B4_9BACT|nr:MAG: 50S ribosomal protein L17 [Candidatus Yanofskybacteria bacterium CG10_big_fil_rev_8_21_14_0_10_36_16]
MRHKNKIKKFGRVKKQRNALRNNLAMSFILSGKITSTEVKLKSLKPFVEKMVTKAKNENLAKRRALIEIAGKKAADKLIDEIAPKFSEREGGYTRIVKLPRREGDGAKMAILEFIK